MARVTDIRDVNGVRVVEREGPGGKPIITSFHVTLIDAALEAGAVQLRVLAEESRELILDKTFAGPVAPGAKARVTRPLRLRRPEIPTVQRRAYMGMRKLAPRTVKKKIAAEQDGRKLIADGDYMYGIEVFKGTRKGEVYYTIRPKPGPHPSAGVTHRVLAAWLEYGTKKMPKRPHWGPVRKIVLAVLREQGTEVHAVALRTALRKVR